MPAYEDSMWWSKLDTSPAIATKSDSDRDMSSTATASWLDRKIEEKMSELDPNCVVRRRGDTEKFALEQLRTEANR